MNFWRDNFNGSSSLWTDHTTNGSVAFSGGGKTFVHNSAGWDQCGNITTSKRTLAAGDMIDLLFMPVTNTAGTPSESSSSFIEFSLKLDNPTFSHSNYGMYIQGSGFYALNHSPIEPPVMGLDTGRRYRMRLEIDPDSGMSVYIEGHDIPNDTRIASFSGPFIGRDAWFLVNIYSADTVRLLNFRGHD